ncbi:MAG: tetratricopeptide repeat protein [Heteroscytonema crispum UTEX LB 1556]
MGLHFERGRLLLEQSRYNMAEEELRQALADCPDDAGTHALLGLCLSCQQRYQEATQEAKTAIALAPDLPFSHYVLGYILCERYQLPDAENSIRQAIRLNPYEASYFALLSRCYYNQRLWQDALEAATQGLTIDPEDVECLNYCALSLSQMGREKEAQATVEEAIALSPEDATSYASSGWIILSHGGCPEKALQYFREALRLNPTLEWARQGIVEALKAKNPIYRLMLRYFLWSSRLNHSTCWVFTIGLYFAVRILLSTFATVGLTHLVTVVALAYLIFVFFSWIADPLFTLLLRWDKFGRFALSSAEIQQSNWWGGCFIGAIAFLVVWLWTRNTTALLGAIVFSLLLIPVAATFHCEQGWTRKAMTIYTIVLASLGISTLIMSIASVSASQFQWLSLLLMILLLLGALLSSWVATLLTGITPKR